MKVESCEGHSRHRWSACKKRPRLSARSLFSYFHSRQLAPIRALPWKTRFLGPGLNPLNPPHALHIAHPHIAAQRDRSLQSLRATEPHQPPAPTPATRVILSTVPIAPLGHPIGHPLRLTVARLRRVARRLGRRAQLQLSGNHIPQYPTHPHINRSV